MVTTTSQHIAVIGAGMAGSACAQALAAAGLQVQVFDKSRGPGGRLATRRSDWVDEQGQVHTTRLDHGALAITARSAAFRSFLDQASAGGALAEWRPTLAADSLALEDGGPLWVPVPDLPSLCRRQLAGVATTHWSCHVDRLARGPQGWQLWVDGALQDTRFDAVLLALPPAQAAPLLSAHRADWARHAAVALMQPCWTLLGVARGPGPAWDLARPATGPLGWVLRSDARPGRPRQPGQTHWVAHARPSWSRQHMEEPGESVMPVLQAALAQQLGQPIDWLQLAVHRWRYAQPLAQGRHGLAPAGAGAAPGTAGSAAPGAPAGATGWWDAALGLGVCGDFLGGAAGAGVGPGSGVGGVEAAWLSAQALCGALLHGGAYAADVAGLAAATPSGRAWAQKA